MPELKGSKKAAGMTPVEGDFERDFETPPGDIRIVVVEFPDFCEIPMDMGADCRRGVYLMIRSKKSKKQRAQM